MSEKVQKGEIASFKLYGQRREDGTIVVGHSGETRVFDEWPKTMALGARNFNFNLEFIEKQMEESVEMFYEHEEIPEESGTEWGVYL